MNGRCPRSQGNGAAGLAARPGRWAGALLAAAILLGEPTISALALPPYPALSRAQAAGGTSITVRGVVLDDSLNVPVAGIWIYLNSTKYGAITNERGEFTCTFPSAWKPVRGGLLVLQVTPVPFTFKFKQVQLDWRGHDPARLLMLRLASAPGRGRPNLVGHRLMAPPVPPPVYPARAHTARP